MNFIVSVLIMWVAPIMVTHGMGKKRNRQGWLWGFLLGWLGVLILFFMPPLLSEEQKELEQQLRVMKLHQELHQELGEESPDGILSNIPSNTNDSDTP
jgi:hypothetical protein